MLNFLPADLQSAINKISDDRLCEVRIRVDKKIKLVLSDGTRTENLFIDKIFSEQELERCVLRLCNYTMYSAEENIKQGFITSSDGERVGLCGECVSENGKIIAVKNITSVCIRFPKYASGVSYDFFDRIMKNGLKSCLVFSPPFQGKTTFLRDLGKNISDELGLNTLFIDERDEFSLGGKADLGQNSDILRYFDKTYGFYVGVRTLNPDVIICDELMNEKDVSAVKFASLSGVKTIASAHSDSISDLIKKTEMADAVKLGVFDYFLQLKNFKAYKLYNCKCEEICLN